MQPSETDLDSLSGSALIEIPIAHFHAAQYSKALESALKINEILLARKDTHFLAANTFWIGRIHYFIRNDRSNDRSMAYFTEALLLSKQYHDSTTLYKTHRGIGAILAEGFFNENKYTIDTALYHLEKAKRLALYQYDYYAASGISCLIGQYSLQAKQSIDYSRAMFFEALDLANKSGNTEGIAFANQKIGLLLFIEGKYKEAKRYLERSLDQFRAINSKDGIINTSMILKDVLAVAGTAEEIDTLWSLSKIYMDSVYNENTAQAFAEYQTKYESEKKEKEIAILKAQSEIHQLKIRNSQFLAFGISFIAVLAVIGIWLIKSRKNLKLQATIEKDKQRAQRDRFKTILNTEEKERKRIAQELHDGVGSLLSTALVSLANENGADSKQSQQLIDNAISEVRNISHNMMPNALISFGLEFAIKDQLNHLDRVGSYEINYHNEAVLEFDESISIAIYRVIQEALNNIIKYAQASRISLVIRSEDSNRTQFEIRDNGKGFLLSHKKNGIGLSNMKSRIELIGGIFTIESKLEEGTSIKFTVPNEH